MRTLTRILGLAALGAAIATAAPAWAETPAECRAMFRSADLNDDGLLSATEIAASDEIGGDLADSLADRGGVSMQEFMAECTD